VTPLETLRGKAAGCTACPLYRHATQTVFGEGDAPARIVLVGEQPGHEEDLAGRPFVGPAAGRALAGASSTAPDSTSPTVKHFKGRKDRTEATSGSARPKEAEEHRFVDDLRRAARIAHHAVPAREEETTR
jgi:DNA polymerase